MVVLEGLLIQWGLIGFGVGSVSTAACGISESCGRRKLKREVDTLKAENETLAQTSARLQTQLDEFEDLSAFLTRSNLQSYEQLLELYAQLRRSLDVQLKSQALQVFCDLDKSNNYKITPDEMAGARVMLKFLFPSQHDAIDEISAADFGSFPTMRPILVKLIEELEDDGSEPMKNGFVRTIFPKGKIVEATFMNGRMHGLRRDLDSRG